MILQVRTESNEIFIAMYETEEPKKEKYINGPEYLRALTQWQSSKREYKVREEDKQQIKELLYENFVGDKLSVALAERFSNDLNGGIDCTFLKNRIKLKPFYTEGELQPWSQMWTLIPLEDKKENEAVEFAEWIDENYTSSWKDGSLMEKGTWREYGDNKTIVYTTSELYQIFKNPNKQ